MSAPRPLSAASERTVREGDLAVGSLASPSDLLRLMPGLVIAQHAGGGKADQIFLRGFDADHGTDVAVSVDGVPNNLVSHAHAQGYADLHWLIPETLAGVETRKGPYFADQGDFGTAGSVHFLTRERFEAPAVTLEVGSFQTRRLLATGSPLLGPWSTVLAAEAFFTDGPFLDLQDLRRLSLFGKLHREVSPGGSFALTLTANDSQWNASGQIPERAVEAGRLERFGAVDPSEGGYSRRHALAASWESGRGAFSRLRLQAFAVDYKLDLFSNFTFFASDPLNGDGIEQVDERRYYGAQASQRWLTIRRGLAFETTLGSSVRLDDADVALFRQRERRRLDVLSDTTVRERTAGVFFQEVVALHRRLRAVAGLRYDRFDFDVSSHLAPGQGALRSGSEEQGVLQPKAGVIVSLPRETEVYFNYGIGFHSNDARAAVINDSGAAALPRAEGYEVGVRTRPATWNERLDVAAVAWRLDLENEFVYVGDEGGTEVRGASRRQGIEMEVRARLAPWLRADLDYAHSRAYFTSSGAPVPLAPRHLLSAGLTLRTPRGWTGSLRLRHVGPRPATEDGRFTARGTTVLDARLGHGWGRLESFLEVQNLTDADFREAQFYNESRLPGEAAPVGDIHFTPGYPRGFRLGLAYRF